MFGKLFTARYRIVERKYKSHSTFTPQMWYPLFPIWTGWTCSAGYDSVTTLRYSTIEEAAEFIESEKKHKNDIKKKATIVHKLERIANRWKS